MNTCSRRDPCWRRGQPRGPEPNDVAIRRAHGRSSMIEQGPDRIRVTAASINTLQSVGNVKGNFEKIVTQINRAHHVGAQLVLTPELVLDGMFVYQIRPYLTRSAEKQDEISRLTHAYVDLAKSIEQNYLPRFSELSRALQIYIGLGTAEHHDGGVYNSILLFSPTGEIVARYRKVKLSLRFPRKNITALTCFIRLLDRSADRFAQISEWLSRGGYSDSKVQDWCCGPVVAQRLLWKRSPCVHMPIRMDTMSWRRITGSA